MIIELKQSWKQDAIENLLNKKIIFSHDVSQNEFNCWHSFTI